VTISLLDRPSTQPASQSSLFSSLSAPWPIVLLAASAPLHSSRHEAHAHSPVRAQGGRLGRAGGAGWVRAARGGAVAPARRGGASFGCRQARETPSPGGQQGRGQQGCSAQRSPAVDLLRLLGRGRLATNGRCAMPRGTCTAGAGVPNQWDQDAGCGRPCSAWPARASLRAANEHRQGRKASNLDVALTGEGRPPHLHLRTAASVVNVT